MKDDEQLEYELMKDFDDEKIGSRYCRLIGCRECDGTDQNGEPNGYGCHLQDDYIEKRYDSILKRRISKLRKELSQ